jgi:hypothetical protein
LTTYFAALKGFGTFFFNMIKVFKSALSLISLTSLICANSFAGGFTSGKGAYDFAIEYMGTFGDKKVGKQKYDYGIEINNDFGITENQTIAIDIFLDKDNRKNMTQGFETRHRMNFKVNDSINLGLQNGLRFIDKNDGTYALRWNLRGMIRHDAKTGFYKHSRLEIEHRRRFDDTMNRLRFDLRTKFRLAEGIDFTIRVNTYLTLAKNYNIEKASIEENNENYAKEAGITSYDLKNIRINNSEVYFGPEFSIGGGQSVYVYGYSQIYAPKLNKAEKKGIAVGYSKSFEL